MNKIQFIENNDTVEFLNDYLYSTIDECFSSDECMMDLKKLEQNNIVKIENDNVYIKCGVIGQYISQNIIFGNGIQLEFMCFDEFRINGDLIVKIN